MQRALDELTGPCRECFLLRKIEGLSHLQIAERLGISRQHIYCAGDEANDLSMLTWAAEGFAPANCVPAVRACGATIVADADHDTLADIVSRLDKMYA